MKALTPSQLAGFIMVIIRIAILFQEFIMVFK